MSTVVDATACEKEQDYKKKLKLVEIEIAESSELPHRVIKKKTGVTLGRFANPGEVAKFLNDYPLSHLQSKPTRRRSR